MNIQWLNIIGLSLDIIGAIIMSFGLIVSKKDAIELGVSKWGGDTDTENLKQPKVRDILKQSRNAIIGLAILVLGFTVQIVANWPNTIQ